VRKPRRGGIKVVRNDSAFAIYVALLDAEEMSAAAKAHLKVMHGNLERMTEALNAIDPAMESAASGRSSRR